MSEPKKSCTKDGKTCFQRTANGKHTIITQKGKAPSVGHPNKKK